MPDVVKVGLQLCDALAHVHERHIIHRDLKPANIVWGDYQKKAVFLIDFGIAKRVHDDVSGRPLDNFTAHDEFVGPQNWCSPELLQYARDKRTKVSPRSDVFQIGKILWFLATNRIGAGIPDRKRDPTGGRLHGLVCSLLTEDPDDRPPIDQIRQALVAIGAAATPGQPNSGRSGI
jgi:serine/threonine protein kinase